MTKPILVIPKGRLYKHIKELFLSKGISLPDADTRQYFYPDWSKDCALFIAKPKAVPQLIHTKYAELDTARKNLKSHRKKALKELGLWVATHINN